MWSKVEALASRWCMAWVARVGKVVLIALATAKPGTLNYATPGIGSAGHLGGELFGCAGV